MAQDEEEEDYMAVLEQKKKEVAAMQAAAQIARESAHALLQTQRRIAEIDALAFGNGAGAGEESPNAATGAGADGCTASQPSPGAADYGVSGDNGAGVGLGAHEHPLVRVRIDEDWVCDGCGARSIDLGNEALPRFQCSAGCDFDLCGRCHLPRSQRAVAAPVMTQAGISPNADGSFLSLEDRRRFGLDTDGGLPPPASGPSTAGAPAKSPPRACTSEAPSAARGRWTLGGRGRGGGGAAVAAVSVQVPRASSGGRLVRGAEPSAQQSSLSEEDRQRFGLDGPLSPEVSARVTAMMPAIAKLGQPGQRISGTGGPASPEQTWGSAGGAGGSMRQTLEQLQAVGLTHLLPKLEETERQLQYLKQED